jgi:hypothetical protein
MTLTVPTQNKWHILFWGGFALELSVGLINLSITEEKNY